MRAAAPNTLVGRRTPSWVAAPAHLLATASPAPGLPPEPAKHVPSHPLQVHQQHLRQPVGVGLALRLVEQLPHELQVVQVHQGGRGVMAQRQARLGTAHAPHTRLQKRTQQRHGQQTVFGRRGCCCPGTCPRRMVPAASRASAHIARVVHASAIGHFTNMPISLHTQKIRPAARKRSHTATPLAAPTASLAAGCHRPPRHTHTARCSRAGLPSAVSRRCLSPGLLRRFFSCPIRHSGHYPLVPRLPHPPHIQRPQTLCSAP